MRGSSADYADLERTNAGVDSRRNGRDIRRLCRGVVLDPPVPIDWRIEDAAFDELTYAGGSKT